MIWDDQSIMVLCAGHNGTYIYVQVIMAWWCYVQVMIWDDQSIMVLCAGHSGTYIYVQVIMA
jgi:hypothetical protein